jgi:hypothetical protein
MVFQGDGRSETRHDSIAPVADDDALIAVNRFGHDLHCRNEKTLRVLRVEIPDDVSRVRDIRK